MNINDIPFGDKHFAEAVNATGVVNCEEVIDMHIKMISAASTSAETKIWKRCIISHNDLEKLTLSDESPLFSIKVENTKLTPPLSTCCEGEWMNIILNANTTS